MADLRIVDAPDLPLEEITDEVKIPTGGKGNYAVKAGDVATFVESSKDLANKTFVNNSSNGVKQQLEAHKNDKENPHNVTKDQIGLGNVNNTADLDKPVSDATSAAIITAVNSSSNGVKVLLDAHTTNVSNPHRVTKAQVGLGNVDNTSDINKPLSTATKTYIDTATTNLNKGYNLDYFVVGKAYPLNAEIMLDNGDVVKSTIPSNTNDPKINMSGWVFDKTTLFIASIAELLATKPSLNRLHTVHSYHLGGQLGGSGFLSVQSNVLVENGVTIFKSKVIGYENYFWVRINIEYITPEMAGAIGDKTYNCQNAFQKCFDIGGDLRLRENAKYLIGSDATTHVGTYFLKCTKPTSITCGGKAQVYFKHSVTTGSPRSIIFEGEGVNLESLKIEGVDWFGHPTVGQSDKVSRAWGIGLFGVDNFSIKRCRFSTFQGHCPDITRRSFDNNGDWIQSSDLNNANTEAAVLRLKKLSSKNGVVENIKLDNCGSTGLAIFGGSNISVKGVDSDMTGALYPYAVWTDDASSQTPLRDYAVNDNITIEKVTSGTIVLGGLASGSVKDCDVDKVDIRSYDFDQQKNNFDSGSHVYNPNDHLIAPFLWMSYLDRGIFIHENRIDKIEVRSIHNDIYKNRMVSKAAAHEFINVDRNGIVWGTGTSYFDEDGTNLLGVKSNISSNTFVLKHNNCICVDYGTASSSSYVNVIDSVIERIDPSFAYTHMRNANQNYRRDSYFSTDVNAGLILSKNINHHIDLKQMLLTQGVGTNHLKTFANIFGNATAQPIVTLTNTTTPVYLFINLVDIAGRLFRKKIELKADNTIVVSDLDSQTIYNASFSVTVVSGIIKLMLTPAGNDLCVDIIGLGTRNNCVFLPPTERATSTG